MVISSEKKTDRQRLNWGWNLSYFKQ